jgi:hypothetical protein
MTRLLERLAMDKVADGDDAGARQVLQVRSRCNQVLHMARRTGCSMRLQQLLAGNWCLGGVTSVCVAEMVGLRLIVFGMWLLTRLLERLAMDKVADGDDAGTAAAS